MQTKLSGCFFALVADGLRPVLSVLIVFSVASMSFGAGSERAVLGLDGSASYHWDEDTVLTNENHLISSIPSAFTGANVGTLIGANTFYSNGATGAGTIALNVEAGHIWDGHESLTHATTRTNQAGAPGAPFGTPAYDRHATWVGMMIGGRLGGNVPGPYQTGIAYDSTLRSGAIATSWTGGAYSLSFNATVSSLAFPYEVPNGGFGTADVINSSWGALGANGTFEAGGTDVRAMILDSLANGNRLTTFVASAGNSGPGVNRVGSPGSGYNGITVGALANDGANNYTSMATFSSGGPQDYRDPLGLVSQIRAAVDISAPGHQLTSAFYGGQRGGNDASLAGSVATGGSNLYSGGVGGTSFAAPIVAGSVSLMHEAADDAGLSVDGRDARVIKANLLNAASKIPGWNNGQVPHPNANGGVRTSQSLDYLSGAGALDLDRTYSQYLLGETDLPGTNGGATAETIGWDYGITSGPLDVNDIVITTPMLAGTEFRATLAWFRERTYNNSSNQVDVGFADLDLEIWDSTFTTLFSDSLSGFNPVEHLTFNLPVTGTYGIRVRHFGNAFGGLNTEEYGLAWWGTAAPIVPEPGTLVLTFLALVGCLGATRRRG